MYYIYTITNKINNKIYVGVSLNVDERWKTHKKIAKDGPGKSGRDFHAIHGAIAKYGEDNFDFSIIEEIVSESDAFDREIYWIDHLQSFVKYGKGYNLTLGGEGIHGYLHSEETKKKLSELASGKYIGKFNPCFGRTGNKHPLYGKSLTRERKDKISAALSGEKGPSAKLSDAQRMEIIQKRKLGIPIKILVEEYKVTKGTIIVVSKQKSRNSKKSAM